MELAQANALAGTLACSLKPYIVRGMVAGSIRRRKPDVKDIELVLIPKWGKQSVCDLFGDQTEPLNLLYSEWAQRIAVQGLGCPRVVWIKTGVPGIVPWGIKPEGKYWRGYLPHHDIKLDIFMARPETWGAVSLIRTGSAAFSEAVVTHAKRVNYRFEGGGLRRGGQSIPVPEEEDVFRLLSIEYVAPPARTGPEAIRHIERNRRR